MMKEEEAKKKWCPFARLCGDGSNRGVNPQCWGEVQCIGSECMAWRWIDANEMGELRHGYCGLAGHPCPAFVINNPEGV